MTVGRDGYPRRILRAVCVTLGLERHPRSRSVRSLTLGLVSLLVFAIAGNGVFVRPLRQAAEKPFEFDWALRTLSLGWFDESRTLPVAFVEIDDATHRGWGSPATAPREAIARMLEVVARSRPAAIVADLDLGYGVEAATDPLGRFLQSYRGDVPIVFPQRVDTDEAGLRRIATGPFDGVFAANRHLHWAHASFAAHEGVVREWDPWLTVCDDRGARVLPAVATELARVLPPGWHGLARVGPPPAPTGCADDPPPGESLLIGRRLTGPGHPPLMAEATLVSASALLDADVARDDAALFADRIVFIGSTYAGSGDSWVTPSGVLPGVELVANTVRFLPLQQAAGARAEFAYRATTVLSFLVLGLLFWLFRPSVAVLVLMPAFLLVVALAVGAWGYFRVFDAIAAALLLFVQCKAIEAALTLVEDWRRYGWRRTILARHFRHDRDDDED